MYDNLCCFENDERENGWKIWYNEPTKRTFYIQEEGMAYMSVITDNVIEAPYTHVLGCYDNLEVLDKVLPDFHDLSWKTKVTDVRGVMYGK